jgi:alpha-beta hydrolase superfamily lysophospholipase
VATELAKAGFVYVTLDFHGHGYSEGSRGLVADPLHLVDDVISALSVLYAAGGTTPDGSGRRSLAELPLYVMGHSMGGGTALLACNILQHGADAVTPLPPSFTDNLALFESTICPAFRGAILVCPVVDMGVSPTIRDWVVGSLAWLLPQGSVPTWMMNENDSNHLVWASRRYRTYIHADGFPYNPAGLSFGGNIYFRTLSTVLNLSKRVLATLPQATFPFVVFHDEDGDIVVPAAGSARLLREAPATSKTLEPVPGGLHDILANRVVHFTTKTLDWLDSRAEPAAGEGGTAGGART